MAVTEQRVSKDAALRQIVGTALNVVRYVTDNGAGSDPHVLEDFAETILDRIKELKGE